MGNGMILANFFQDAWNHICSALYAMFSIIFRLMDWIQSVFRALVGLEPMKINGTMINDGEQQVDVVFHLIQTDIIQDIFWSMVTFSLILMFMMTFLAIIRNAYQDKPKPVGSIIGEVFRGLTGMILIPVFCFAGLMFGNVILQAVDAGTSFGSASTLSATLFMSSAYDANIARDNSDAMNDGLLGMSVRQKNYKELLEKTNFGEYLNKHGASNYNNSSENFIKSLEQPDWEKIADHIDDAFTMGAITYNSNGEVLDLYDPWKVNICYNMGSFNFIIMLVGGCTVVGFLFKMCFGLITRMFKLLFDFVLIPVVLAMMPFDGGKAKGSWQGDFVKNTTLSYGTIGAINLFYSILPVVNDLEFTWGHGGFFTAVLKLVMVIIGLFSADKLISTVTGWFGVGDLIGEGKSAYDTFKGGLDKVTKQTKNVTGKVAGTFVGGMAGAKQAQKTGGTRFGGFLAGAYGGSGLKAKVDPLIPKGFGDAEKTGKEAYEASRKFGFTESMKESNTGKYLAAQSASKVFKEADDLGLTGKDLEEFIESSELGQRAKESESFNKEYKEIERRTKANEKRAEKSSALDLYAKTKGKETSFKVAARKLVTSAGSFSPTQKAEYETYLKSGSVADIPNLLAGKSEEEKGRIIDALDKAKENYEATNEASYNALKTFMKENKYVSLTTPSGDILDVNALKNLDSGDLRQIIETGTTKFNKEDGSFDNGINLYNRAETLSKTLKDQYAQEQSDLDSYKKQADTLLQKAIEYIKNPDKFKNDPQLPHIKKRASEIEVQVAKSNKK